MNFTSEQIIAASLSVGCVFKLSAPELIDTTIPHYFIVVAIDGSDNYLVLCTTQLDKKINYLNKSNTDLNTIAYLEPSDDNGLTDKTYINCNDYHFISKENLIDKLHSGSLSFKGKVSSDEYDQIVTSIKLSYKNDLPEYLLVYES
ncbi:MAG: hypothetical protein JXR27_00915 [Paludibacteraceae bacterium]|nr:hypothetical protein [Paludibacteraceae bacterium]